MEQIIIIRHKEHSGLNIVSLNCKGIAAPSTRARNDGVGLPFCIKGLSSLFLRLAMIVWGMLMVAGCSDRIEASWSQDGTSGRESNITLTLAPVPESGSYAGTRVITDDLIIEEGTAAGYAVEDVWVIEYDNEGNRLGKPAYYTKYDMTAGTIDLPVILPQDEDLVFSLVVIANTHKEVFHDIIEANTIDKLKRVSLDVPAEMHLYNQEVEDVHPNDLIMNGVVNLTIDGGNQVCDLYRNIAKLTVTLSSAANSNVTITHVRLCNVPNKLYYADRLYNTEELFPTRTQAGFLLWQPYELETALTPGSGAESITFYLPRNMRGQMAHTEPEQKVKAGSPEQATYIEVLGMRSDTQSPLRYTFYIGGNMYDDYNVIPNNHYTLPIVINSVGSALTDPRVEDIGVVELGTSNCYIINPLITTAQRVYKVPTERVSQFWTLENGDQSSSVSGPWVAEVIWQDQPCDLIRFCNDDGTIPATAVAPNAVGATQGGLTYQGVGCPSSFSFKPMQGAQGNVVIGVRKATETGTNRLYLWSWHLWITDYNPDSAPMYSEWSNEYEYDLGSGDRVLHYADASGSDHWQTAYSNAMIMDRNLGAMTPVPTGSDNWQTIGLFYYIGRKDPFPPYSSTYNTLYGITGEPQTIFTIDEKSNIMRVIWDNLHPEEYPTVGYNTMVNRPYAWYSQFSNGYRPPYSAYGNSLGTYNNQIWSNPTWYIGEMVAEEGKSLFDPCPQGWQVAHPDSWNIFMTGSHRVRRADGNGNGLGDSLTVIANTPTPELFDSRWTKGSGIEFYFTATGYGPTVWIPFAGSLTEDGLYGNNGSYFQYYNNRQPNSNTRSFSFGSISSGVNGVRLRDINPVGNSVRCVKVE